MPGIRPVIASTPDADEAFALIVRCREAMEGSGMEQWPGFYPDLDVVTRDIERRVLWILREEGEVTAAITIDDVQPEPYASIEFRFGGPYICVHRLAVDPSRQREGLAGKMMAFAEELGAREGCGSVRLDTYGLNDAANSFYGKLGYEKRGTIHLPKKPGEYNCFEKALQPGIFRELVAGSRSVRRFREGNPVKRELLESLVDLARLSPSGANRQPLKFLLSSDAERNALVFPHLKWAGYIKGWDGPADGERPGGYIVILGDTEVSKGFGTDHGIAAQSIMLGAASMGLGGCIIGSVDRGGLAEALGLSGRYEILLVLAMGHPAEEIVVEDVTDETGIRYWRSEDGVHHVPKRSLAELIIDP